MESLKLFFGDNSRSYTAYNEWLSTAGAHKSREPDSRCSQILHGVAYCLLVLSVELISCSHSGAYNSEVEPRSLCTPILQCCQTTNHVRTWKSGPCCRSWLVFITPGINDKWNLTFVTRRTNACGSWRTAWRSFNRFLGCITNINQTAQYQI